MTLLLIAFGAGILTVAAPCILPLLPVIVGGSLLTDADQSRRRWYRPLVIAASLGLSVVVFTLALKSTTALLGVPQMFWQFLSGLIITAFGIALLWPQLWESFIARIGFNQLSNRWLNTSYARGGIAGDVLLGAALGPVFSSCSPTYALIVAGILPVSFWEGLLYLLAYAFGLSLTLVVIAFAGQAAVARLRWLSNPHSWFKRAIGILFIVVGLSVMAGFDKRVQVWVLDNGWYDPVMKIEERL